MSRQSRVGYFKQSWLFGLSEGLRLGDAALELDPGGCWPSFALAMDAALCAGFKRLASARPVNKLSVSWLEAQNLGYVHEGPKRMPGEPLDHRKVWCRQRLPFTLTGTYDILDGEHGLLGRVNVNIGGAHYRDVAPGFRVCISALRIHVCIHITSALQLIPRPSPQLFTDWVWTSRITSAGPCREVRCVLHAHGRQNHPL